MIEKRYASDYRLEPYVTPDGKYKQRPVYQGAYYTFCQPAEQIRRLQHTVLFCTAAVVLGILPLLLSATQISHTFYVLLPMALSLIPLYYVAGVGIRLGQKQEKLTRQQRDQTDRRLRRSSLWLAALTGLLFAGTVLYWALEGMEPGDWWCLAGHALACGAALYLLTQRTKAQTKQI